MRAIRRILLSLAVICAAALVGGGGLAIAAVATLSLCQLCMAAIGKRLTGGGKLAAAILLALGFAFSAVTVVSALLPMVPIQSPLPHNVFLQQDYAGVLILAILTALVQTVAGGWELPLYLGFAQPPKAFRGLPLALLTLALVILALSGFMGLRIA